MNTNTFSALTSMVDLLLDAICVVDTQGRIVFVSAACERIFGYTPQEMIGLNMIELVAPEDRERTLLEAAEVMAGKPRIGFENRYVHKDGRLVDIMWSARWSEQHQLRIAVARDITERKKAQARQSALYAISEAAHAAKDLPSLFAAVHRIINQLLPAQHFCVALCGAAPGQFDFPYPACLPTATSTSDIPDLATLCAEVVASGQPLLVAPDTFSAMRDDLRTAFGNTLLCWLGVPLQAAGRPVGVLVLSSYPGGPLYNPADIDLLQFVCAQIATAIERQRLLARLHYSAHHDALTGLPNRALLFDRLANTIARSRRHQERMALLYIDLDKFKNINDSFGHAAGDALLQEVAMRLKQCVREADTVARIGGDEFVVLLENIHTAEYGEAVAAKIRSALSQPVTIVGNALRSVPSIGIALYPEHGENAEALLIHADGEMYREKKSLDAPICSLPEPA